MHEMLKAKRGEAAAPVLCSCSNSLLPLPPLKTTPSSSSCWNLCKSTHTHNREIQLPALPGSKPTTEAHPAMSRQQGRTGIRSNNCYYYRQEGHTTANRRQSNYSSKVSYKLPAESDLPASLKSLSQTHSSEQIQTEYHEPQDTPHQPRDFVSLSIHLKFTAQNNSPQPPGHRLGVPLARYLSLPTPWK